MSYLAKKDVSALLECARIMYAGVGRADFHIHVITALKRAFSSTVALWARMDVDGAGPPAMTVYSYPLGYFPPTFCHDLSALAHYHPAFIVPALARGLPLPKECMRPIRKKFSRGLLAQRAVRISDAESRAQFRGTPLYQELFRPLGLEFQMGFFSMREDAWMGAVIFCRDRVDFSERERRMLDMLVPHIRRAFAHDKAVTLREPGGLSSAVASAPNIYECNALAVSPSGGLKFCTGGAKLLLEKHFGERAVSRGRLPSAIMECFAADERGGILLSVPGPFALKSRHGGLSALVGANGPDGAIPLYLYEAVPPARARATLTDRQSDVLYWVASGKTNKDIAQILAISPLTVRAHLEHIYKKLGVENRTAAAAFATSPSPVNQ